jgi:hypothetical protein
VAKIKERLWLHTTFDHQLSCDKKKRKDQIQLCMAFSEIMEDLLKQQALKESK